MVDLTIGLSRPCGKVKEDYNARKYDIIDLYKDNHACSYSSPDGNKEHPLYFETGFKDEEYNVYSQNNLIS
jgi:hypothetical protein